MGRPSLLIVAVLLAFVLLTGSQSSGQPPLAEAAALESGCTQDCLDHTSELQTPSELQLANKYAPIVYLKAQRQACDRSGEPFVPAPVTVVLGDPEVSLRGPDRAVIKTAPKSADLAVASADSYIDLPGNPRNPGCSYERAFQARMSGLEPTTYAHIAIDEEESKLALQYWFYYYFNDFNNTHESDWEMIQLVFDTASVEAALASEPAEVAFAQHAGGERADWQDDKLEREGDRPVVYAASGSHGSYFENRTYIGWGRNGTGLGCDDASPPSVRTPLTVELLPNEPDPDGPYGWLLFEGRWGEKQPWEFNGPTGPFGKEKWDDPIGATDDWRTFSLRLPTSRSLGPAATDFFCSLSSGGSALLIYAGVHQWLVILGVLAATAVFFTLLLQTRDLFLAAIRTYRQHLGVFLRIGLIAIPIGWAFNGFAVLLAANPPLEWGVQWFNNGAFARLAFAGLVGFNQQAVMLLAITPAVVQAMADISAGEKPGARRSFRGVVPFLPVLLATSLLFAVGVGVLLLLAITAPLAILLGLRWQFFGQATILDGAPNARTALRMSSDAVHWHWLLVLSATFVIQTVSVLPGPVLGLLLLIPGGTSVQFANGASSFVYVITIPVATIALSLLYLKLKGRHLDPE